MGLIEFLEGAYKGGRLLFLLYDHDKQVKLRYKAIKDSGIKRLPNLSGVIVSESIKHAEKQALVNNTPKRKPYLNNGLVSHYATGNDLPLLKQPLDNLTGSEAVQKKRMSQAKQLSASAEAIGSALVKVF